MRDEIDGMMVVRAELCDRLDSLQQAMARANVRDLSQRIASIRTMASAYGMIPVVCLCDAFDRAVRAQPRGCPAGLYFERLRDAIGCQAQSEMAGEEASEALLASISIRLRA
jgi:hypothetical protein